MTLHKQLAALIIAVLVGCSDPQADSARGTYNEGLALLESGDFDGATEKFLAARGEAGDDSALRYRAAFNLGLALSQKAESMTSAEPEQALAIYRQSASWFRDAARTRPDDELSRESLAAVITRIQVLADELSRQSRSLAGRLDRILADQRGVRDRIRALDQAPSTSLRATGSGGASAAIAQSQRVVLAEAGAVTDLAADEIAGIERRAGKQPAPKDAARIAQLEMLTRALSPARGAMADTRRALRDGDPIRAGRRATDAIDALLLARELLLAPVAVLGRIATDEARLLSQTEMLGKQPGEESPENWLTSEFLAASQGAIANRLSAIRARIAAIASATLPDPGAKQMAQAPSQPDAAEQKRAATASLPHVDRAAEAMASAADHLAGARLEEAAAAEREALSALARVLEEHAGIRQLIELAVRDHQKTRALLAPPEGSEPLPAAERNAAIDTLIAQNQHRLTRLETLFASALAKAKKPDQQKLYELAETERAAVNAALEALSAAVDGGRRGEALTEPAETATAHLEKLRELFLTIVERLKKLAGEQARTRDTTASAALPGATDAAGDIARSATAEAEHAKLAEVLAQALAKRADALASAPQPSQGQGPGADAFATAAEETRGAQQAMAGAASLLAEARNRAQTMSVDLSPAIENQASAIDHLRAAIDALTPDRKNKNQKKQGDNKNGNDKQEQSDKQGNEAEPDPARENALRKLQAIRNREAARDRNRRKVRPAASAPVEKDW